MSSGELGPEAAEDWVGLEWGAFGGPAAREVVLWVALQREFRRRSLLSAPAVRRLSAIGFRWQPEVRARALLPLQGLVGFDPAVRRLSAIGFRWRPEVRA